MLALVIGWYLTLITIDWDWGHQDHSKRNNLRAFAVKKIQSIFPFIFFFLTLKQEYKIHLKCNGAIVVPKENSLDPTSFNHWMITFQQLNQ